MSSEPLNTAAFMYDPSDFGRPHNKAEKQVTEPFHWQCPKWARADYHLYYYEGYGHFDRPLYTTKMPDGRKFVVSYGDGKRFNRSPIAEAQEAPQKRPKVEMVDVYNVDEFVEEVSLRLLIRFSGVASVAFSDSGQKKRVKPKGEGAGIEETERRMSPHNTIVKLVKDGASDQVEEVAYGAARSSSAAPSPCSTASETSRSARTRSDTRTTGLTIPKEIETTPRVDSRRDSRVRHRRQPRLGEPSVKKELRLDLDVLEMPSSTTVREAIAWMKSNEKRHGDQTLLYGPDNLTKLSLEDLIDLYQAALAFGMQPWPGRLKLELNERLTRTKLDFRTFCNITRWLPLADSCLARAINQLDYHTFGGHYTDAEVDMITAFMSRPGNEALRARVHELHIVRRNARLAKSNRDKEQTNPQSAQQPAQVIARQHHKGQEVREDQISEPTDCQPQVAIDPPESTPRRHRRRARRRQQPEGKSIDGIAVAGADCS